MRGPLSGANMTSNSLGLLFYSVLFTFLPAKVMMFNFKLIFKRIKDLMDLMDMMDMMDMMDPLLPTKFLSVAFAAYYLLVCTLLPESPQWQVKSTSLENYLRQRWYLCTLQKRAAFSFVQTKDRMVITKNHHLRALGSCTAQVGLSCKNSSYYSNVSLA